MKTVTIQMKDEIYKKLEKRVERAIEEMSDPDIDYVATWSIEDEIMFLIEKALKIKK